jgi:hypothetical protein
MDSQVMVALALSLVGGLSTSIGIYIYNFVSTSSILLYHCVHFHFQSISQYSVIFIFTVQ